MLDKTASLGRNVTILPFMGLLLTLVSGINPPPSGVKHDQIED